MDIKQLNALLALSQLQSFVAAAERLHITQPALTKRIQLLEQSVGTPLIDRHRRTFGLTAAGEITVKLASSVNQQIEDCRQQIRDLDTRITGPLKLAISHHLGLHRLPTVLREYSRRYNDVTLQIEFTDSEKAYEAISQGEFDMAIVTLSPTKQPETITEVIWPDPMGVVTSEDHPLAARGFCNLSQLAKYPAVLPGLDTYTGQIVQRVFDKHRLTLELAMTTNYLETVASLVSIGQGWSVLPIDMVKDSLVIVDVQGLNIHRDLGIVRHPTKPTSKAAQALIDLLRTKSTQQ